VLICNGCNVGSVVKNDKEITINFFKTLPLNTVEDAVYAGTQYTFKSGEYLTVRNGYKAWYGGGDIIKFTHDDDPFFIIEHNNNYVGKLRHAKYTEDGAFVSGEIDIDSDDTAYAPFKAFNGQAISTSKSFLSAGIETF